jgi:hypothetical protein
MPQSGWAGFPRPLASLDCKSVAPTWVLLHVFIRPPRQQLLQSPALHYRVYPGVGHRLVRTPRVCELFS